MKKEAIFFDVDGTLVDTNDAHVDAWQRAFSRLGYDVSREAIRPQIGKGGDKLVPSILGEETDRKDGEAIRKAHDEEFLALSRREHFNVFPGVPELMKDLHRWGVKVAAITSSKQEHLDATLKSSGLELGALVDERLTKSDAAESKPAPDLVEAALAKLGVDPQRCAMVGDSPYDGEACRRAGIPFVGLTCGGNSRSDLANAGALYVWRDPEELRHHLDRVLF